MKHSLTIYDDPMLYIQGLSNLLLQNKIFSSINQFSTHDEFMGSYRVKPTDYVMYGSHQKTFYDIVDSVSEIIQSNKQVRIAVIGNHFDLPDIRKLFEKGIHCYLEKDTSIDEFLDAMKILKSNEIYLCSSAKDRMINYISNQNQNVQQNSEALTKREIEVMKLICDGHSSKTISEMLFISINTVETHRKKILMKLNVRNSIGIVKYAAEHNMLD